MYNQLTGGLAHSLVHVEEDVSATVTVSLDGCFLRARHIQVIVGQPRLFLHVVHVTDVMPYREDKEGEQSINICSQSKHLVLEVYSHDSGSDPNRGHTYAIHV